MIEIKIPSSINQDYENNFISRKDIDIRLTFEELKKVLENNELQEQTRATWHFKFYMKQLFWLSWNHIHSNIELSHGEKIEMFKQLEDMGTYSNFNDARALIVFIQVSFFIKSISKFKLCEIFNGTSIYDDYCAQIAYHEYKSRY